MLEILGMEREASTVMQCFLVMGISGGIIGGYIAGAKKREKDVFGIILAIICSISGGIAFIKGLWPGIALFFTFQWKTLLKGLFLGLLVAFVLGFFVYFITVSLRISKYARNPITKEATTLC